MLQFWKKTGDKEKRINSPNKSPEKSASKRSDIISEKHGHIHESSTLNGPLSLYSEEELEEFCSECPITYSSRLSKSLQDVLSDKRALTYFVQYMQAREAEEFIRFWIDVNKFQRLFCDINVSDSEESSSIRVTVQQLECLNVPDSTEPCVGCNVSSHGTEIGCDIVNRLNEDCSFRNCRTEQNISLYHSNSAPLSLEDMNTCTSPIRRKDSNSLENLDSYSIRTSVVTHNTISNPEKNCTLNFTSNLDKSPCHKNYSDLINEVIRIYRTYFSHRAKYLIKVPEELKEKIKSNICSENKLLRCDCFQEVQSFVCETMEKEYFYSFLHSDFYCKYQMDILTSEEVTVSDIIFNETALFYFTEFLEQEGHRILLEFLLVAVNFQQQITSTSLSEAQNDAIILYNKYFSLQASCPLGFSDKIRIQVEHGICKDDNSLFNCFEKPVQFIFNVLKKNYLQPFLTSQLYFKYLSELLTTIDANPPLLTRVRKSGSECSSEISISTQNTLLAMEDPSSVKKLIKNIYSQEMRIDTKQLYDPDSLWRRHQHGLSIGRVSEMGRFITDVEREPNKKSESRITKAVKKFVNVDKDKAKEEVAWQIAEKIVKDITRITLNDEEEEDFPPS